MGNRGSKRPSVAPPDTSLITSISSSIGPLFTAAETVQSHIGRVHVDGDCTERWLHTCRAAALASASDFKQNIRIASKYRLQWMEKQCEELAAGEAALMATAAMCDWSGVDDATLIDSLLQMLPVATCNTFNRLSPFLGCGFETFPLVDCIQLFDGELTLQCSGYGLRWCEPGDSSDALLHNRLIVTCVDCAGEPVTGLRVTDLTLSVLSDDGAPLESSVHHLELTKNCFSFSYAVQTDMSVDKLTLHLTVLTCVQPVTVKVGGSLRGNCVRTVDISVEKKLYLSGLAVNAEGTLLAVSIQNSHEIAIYSLPEMTLLSRFGGPGRFRFPEKLCFSPNTGNLLVSCGHISGVQVCPLTSRYVACCHIRIVPQEVTVDGTSVRGYGFFRIDGVVWAVTANVHVVVVGTNSDDQQVYVFDIVSGALIRSFGERGGLLGHVCGCVGLRVSPDGKHIIIAESDNRRVSLFSLTGKFVRSYGEGTLRSAWDVDYAPNGDIVVADQELSCISVFSLDGTMLRTIDVPDIRNNSPTALAVHAGNLYVLTRKRKPHLVILE